MNASARIFLSIAIVLAGFLVSGCSTKARRVDCEWRLEPINQPASKLSQHRATTSSETGRDER